MTTLDVVVDRPPLLGYSAGSGDNSALAHARRVINEFDIEQPIHVYDFPDKGNINRHTFLVTAGPGQREYLLQQVNQLVFVRPNNVMSAMIAAIDAQRSAIARPPEDWDAITLIPVHSGEPYLEIIDHFGLTYWRLMEKMVRAHTFKSLSEIVDREARLRVAREAGRGLAIFGDLTASVDTERLANPLPGYRDARGYYHQLFSVLEGHRTAADAAAWLPADPDLLHSTGRHYLVHAAEDVYWQRRSDPDLQAAIATAEAESGFGLTLARALETGAIRTVAIHGDTKLDNFLFCDGTNCVKAMVDLDTIMPHTWLADWGDMARSLVNVAGEKEPDLARVQVDIDVYRALANGFLGEAHAVTDEEVKLMADAVEIITLELGVRFLTDYLRGDTYFQLGPTDPSDLNKTRALVQFTLLRRLRDASDVCREAIDAARSGTRRAIEPAQHHGRNARVSVLPADG